MFTSAPDAFSAISMASAAVVYGREGLRQIDVVMFSQSLVPDVSSIQNAFGSFFSSLHCLPSAPVYILKLASIPIFSSHLSPHDVALRV